jgi:hypothetical protein
MKKRTILMWAMILPLGVALFITGCKDNTTCPTVVYTTLDATITSAQTLHDGAVEGTEIGQYQAGSKAELQTAIDNATTVRNTNCVTQAELDAAKTNLDAAVTVFNSKEVTDVSPENLVAHWLFNGNAKDATANHNDGTPTAGHTYFGGGAAPNLVADRFGNPSYCYHFDMGCNVEVPYSSALNPPAMSISMWIYLEQQPDNMYMIAMDRWNGWKLNLQTSNFLFYTVKVNDNGTETIYDRDSNPGAVTAGVWTHVAVTFTSAEEKFFINGAKVAEWTNVPGNAIAVDNINLSIGSDLPTGQYSADDTSPYYVNWGGYWKGEIDDIRFYNTAITETQVNSIYLFEKDHVVE